MTAKETVVTLHSSGKSYNAIQRITGINKSTIAYWVQKFKQNNEIPHEIKPAKSYDWKMIQAFVDDGHTVREASEKFGFSVGYWGKAVKTGKVKSLKISYTERLNRLIQTRGHRQSVKRLIMYHDLIPYVCAVCKMKPEWNGKPLSLRLDHINGINNDHRLENLRFVCPNCDSQLPTFCWKNVKRKSSQ